MNINIFLFLNNFKKNEHKHIFSFCFSKKLNKIKINTKNRKVKILPNIFMFLLLLVVTFTQISEPPPPGKRSQTVKVWLGGIVQVTGKNVKGFTITLSSNSIMSLLMWHYPNFLHISEQQQFTVKFRPATVKEHDLGKKS